MTDEKPRRRLEPLPDALVGRAVKDKDFRDRVLALREDAAALKKYLAVEGFKNLSPEALAFIAGLNSDAVHKVLREVDAGEPIEEIAGA